MRAIDADAMLVRLEKWNTSDSTDKALYNFTLNRIQEQPTIEPEQKTGKWIPCSERLPDINRDVLLQFSNSMGVGFWEHDSWGVNTGDNIYSEIGEREAQPIAWMPLPEPYKEGEQNE